MSNYTRILTKEDVEVINANFDINLEYQNTEHYRAAQVIWNLWKSPLNPANVEEKKENQD